MTIQVYLKFERHKFCYWNMQYAELVSSPNTTKNIHNICWWGLNFGGNTTPGGWSAGPTIFMKSQEFWCSSRSAASKGYHYHQRFSSFPPNVHSKSFFFSSQSYFVTVSFCLFSLFLSLFSILVVHHFFRLAAANNSPGDTHTMNICMTSTFVRLNRLVWLV